MCKGVTFPARCLQLDLTTFVIISRGFFMQQYKGVCADSPADTFWNQILMCLQSVKHRVETN